MRTILLMVALAACGSSDSAHDVVDCEIGAWPAPSPERCETACAMGPSNSMPSVDCKRPGEIASCFPDNVATFDGQRGCCAAQQGVVVFTPCEGE